MKKINLSYFAGIFDGEGSISLSKTNSSKSNTFVLYVCVGNTNEWIIQQLKFCFGGIVTYQEPKGNKKPRWMWTLQAQKALGFLVLIEPYLHIKRPQAEIAIRFQKHKRRTGVYSPPQDYLDLEKELKEAMSRLNHRGKIKSL